MNCRFLLLFSVALSLSTAANGGEGVVNHSSGVGAKTKTTQWDRDTRVSKLREYQEFVNSVVAAENQDITARITQSRKVIQDLEKQIKDWSQRKQRIHFLAVELCKLRATAEEKKQYPIVFRDACYPNDRTAKQQLKQLLAEQRQAASMVSEMEGLLTKCYDRIEQLVLKVKRNEMRSRLMPARELATYEAPNTAAVELTRYYDALADRQKLTRTANVDRARTLLFRRTSMRYAISTISEKTLAEFVRANCQAATPCQQDDQRQATRQPAKLPIFVQK